MGLCVTAVEGSLTRATIAAARVESLPGVEIVAAPFDRIAFPATFSIVVLVGVLEYAAMYSDSSHPYDEFLRRSSLYLDDSGVFVVAIENRLGTKYWAGTPKDHTGYPYMGLDDAYPRRGPRTFGLKELTRFFNRIGFTHTRTLTPIPDYKLVRSVIDFQGLPSAAGHAAEHLVAAAAGEDSQLPISTPFSAEQAHVAVVRNGLGLDLGNSFLLVAAREEQSLIRILPGNDFIWHFASERKPDLAKCTVIGKVGHGLAVRRSSLCVWPVSECEAGHGTPSAQVKGQTKRTPQVWT
jgi:O-antigen biosynthesis protein